MDALIVYPKDKEQLNALKTIMKAMKVTFEQKSEIYPEWVMEGVKDSLNEVKAEKLTPFTGIKDMLELK